MPSLRGFHNEFNNSITQAHGIKITLKSHFWRKRVITLTLHALYTMLLWTS